MKQKTKQWFNKSRLRSAIRREWLYSPLRREALARARLERGVYKCESCSKIVDTHSIEVNHKIQVTPETGLNTPQEWGEFIGRMLFCGLEGLEAICTQCHEAITQKERQAKKDRNAKNKLAKKKNK